MIKALTHAGVWVHNQDEALAFYTEKLGLEVRQDVTVPEMGGSRWIPVAVPGPEYVSLPPSAVPGPPAFDEETAAKLRYLIAKSAAGGLFFAADDVDATYSEQKDRRVDFSQEPTDQPYGREAGIRDP